MPSHPPDVRLRVVTDDDLPILFEHQRDPVSNAMAAFPAKEREAFFAHWAKIRGDAATWVRTILLGDAVAGMILSFERGGERLLGYWIGREYWGRGVATAALAQFLPLLPIRPVFAHVARHNLASRRVLEKCGFVLSVELTEALPPPSDGVEEWAFRLD